MLADGRCFKSRLVSNGLCKKAKTRTRVQLIHNYDDFNWNGKTVHRIRHNMQQMDAAVIVLRKDYCFHLVAEWGEPADPQLFQWAFDLFSNRAGTQGFWPLALQDWIGCQLHTVSISPCAKTLLEAVLHMYGLKVICFMLNKLRNKHNAFDCCTYDKTQSKRNTFWRNSWTFWEITVFCWEMRSLIPLSMLNIRLKPINKTGRQGIQLACRYPQVTKSSTFKVHWLTSYMLFIH